MPYGKGFDVGDRVRVTQDLSFQYGGVRKGDVGTVERLGATTLFVRVDGRPSEAYGGCFMLFGDELEPAPVRQLQVGDRVKVVDRVDVYVDSADDPIGREGRVVATGALRSEWDAWNVEVNLGTSAKPDLWCFRPEDLERLPFAWGWQV